MIDCSKYPWASYGGMVYRLNKPMGSHAADLLHAAVGVSGEVAELMQADTRKNTVEECGDIEFYLEAGWQALERAAYPAPKRREIRGGLSVSGYVLQDLVISSGRFLDLAKKVWVYNKDISYADFAGALEMLQTDLTDFYRVHDLDRDRIRTLNMDKLVIRYRDGKYSDAQAQQRADKEA